MDMDLDLDDLDFGDRVKEFLEHKLEEIKSNNASIEQKIKERKQQQEILQSEINDQSECSISFKWKKCFNKKYVICYEIQNDLHRPLQYLKTLLWWVPSNELTYDTTIYSINKSKECTENTCQNITKTFIRSIIINSIGFIIIVIKIPNYLDDLKYVITGKMLANCDGKEIIRDLPNVQISSEDITNREVCSVALSSGNTDNLITAILTSDTTDLVFIFPSDWIISLDSTFEIHCSLTKITVSNSCRKYFMANRISSVIDDSIIAVHNAKTETTVWVTVYYSTQNALFAILHHLHQHIPGLIVFPSELYERYEIKKCITNNCISTMLQQFQKCVNKELDLIETSNESSGSDKIRQFRSKLADLERDTDFLYLKICELNKYNTI